MILPCSCRHAYQDEIYGRGMRWHNPAKGKDGGKIYRCTVCGSVKSAAGEKAGAKPTREAKAA